ncbi:transcriptional regulator [Streptomyces badius]
MDSGFLTESGKTFSGRAAAPAPRSKWPAPVRPGSAWRSTSTTSRCAWWIWRAPAGSGRPSTSTTGAHPPMSPWRGRPGSPRGPWSRRTSRSCVRWARRWRCRVSSPADRCGRPDLGWNEVPAQELFADALAALRPGHPALPVASENEANLAALAELWFGGLGDVRSFLYLTGEIGVGGGAGPERRTAARGARFRRGDRPCGGGSDGVRSAGAGRGGLEQYAGQAALLRAAGIEGIGGASGVLELERRAAARTRARWPRSVKRAACGRGALGAVNLVDPGTRWCSVGSTGA